MKIRLIATAVLLLTQLAFAQETRPGASIADRVVKLARGSPTERIAAILFLEDSRSTDVALWKVVLGYGEEGGQLDRKRMARAIRALGRVGEPELKFFLKELFDESDLPWQPEFRRALGLAVGLFDATERVGELSVNGVPANFFAMGLMKKVPPEGPPPVPADDATAESRPGTGADTFTDPVEAALRWGAVIDPPVFADLARSVLTEHKTPIRLRAAADYFARSKAKAPAALRPLLTEQLNAQDPELAGLAARALAKAEGAGDAEVAAIEAAFAAGTDRIAEVDQIRALGAMKSAASAEALVRAIGLSKSDPAVRRTVMEALKGVAWDKVKPESRKTAGTLVKAIVVPGEGQPLAPADVRAAAVAALAAIDPARFQAVLPELRLGAPWPVRAAAAAALLSQPGVDETWVKRFLADPDRRVRIAFLEAFAEKPPPKTDQLSPLLEPLVRRFSSTPNHYHFPLNNDPVEISTLAAAIKAGDPMRAKLFLEGLFGPPIGLSNTLHSLPDHEVEALQSVLDLVAATEWDRRQDVLAEYLKSSEISLRKRAKEHLAKLGKPAREEPPEDEGARERMLEACIASATSLFDNPAPTALIETSKGNVTIQLFAVDAPLTVHNFLKLAKSGFYDGILWHRVVPAFVAQAGCPRGDGWEGPGYTIRCEVNDRTYRRGSVGMALAGKDTGGSQFFICHRALPHLDGRYTLFGQVIDGMDVVDKLGQDDVILKIREI